MTDVTVRGDGAGLRETLLGDEDSMSPEDAHDTLMEMLDALMESLAIPFILPKASPLATGSHNVAARLAQIHRAATHGAAVTPHVASAPRGAELSAGPPTPQDIPAFLRRTR